MNEEYPSGRSILGWAALGVLGLLALSAVIAIATFGIRWATAGPKGKLQAREQILSGNNRIQAYDHFFNLCAAVQTADQALDASYAQLPSAGGDDRARIETNITAQLVNRSETVNQYNADARKSYTIGQFRSSNLPFELPTTYTRGVTTSCTA